MSQIFAETLDTFVFPEKFNDFIREMSLVYLIAQFEKCLGNTLEIIFTNIPEVMISSQKKISYEEVLNSKTLEDIKGKIVEREINSIINLDIEELNTWLKECFKLDLSKNKDWKKFKECFYMRNIVIHNDCYPSTVYRRKTGYSGKRKRLSITKVYLKVL